ncbi:MAG TPA: hypothetical protein VMM83_02390 [Longimicrobiales bacterium]|nr:hypothetical protein [Longimicrobiales bacterium]
MKTPLALRLALIAGLLALIVTGIPTASDAGRVGRLAGEDGDAVSIASLLLAPAAPAAVFRDVGAEPTELEIEALAALAGRAPLFVALPPDGPTLSVTAPDAPRTGRYAAVGFTAYADAGDTVTARLLDVSGGVLDSLRLVADSLGAARGAFRVRPGREGWTEWRVSAGGSPDGERRLVGAWVAAADPPRVLVVAGPPSWESRHVLRALERSGADVSLVQRVGRDNVITAGDVPVDWGTERALGQYDVVVLLPDADAAAASVRALETWVEEGKGVMVAADGSPAPGVAVPTGPGAGELAPVEHRADALAWSAPAEIAPLPAADLVVRASAVNATLPGATVAARAPDGDALLTLAPFGRGRTVVLGLRETWRWTMEAGLEAEHRAFWRSLVDWLAVPSADSLGVRASAADVEAGATVDMWSGGNPLELGRPGAEGAEAVPSSGHETGWSGRFVTADPGIHEIRAAGATVTAVRARATSDALPAVLGRARLSLLAAASGGEALEPDSFAARAVALGEGQYARRWWPAMAFALLALVALAEWSLRRLRGRS